LKHYDCYETHRPPIWNNVVTVVDRFGTSTVALQHLKRICAPADKNDESDRDVFDPDHLSAYTIKQTSPRFTRVRGLAIVNQFGTIAVDLVKPDRLLVPTVKSFTGLPTPAAPFGVDHFKCYKVGRTQFRAFGIKVDDQFGTSTVDIKRPTHVCVPADKNGEGVPDPTQNLTCYKVGPTARTSQVNPPDLVFVNNQFGTESYGLQGQRELCVPSEVMVP